jgi:hypothetical protein
MSSTTSGGSFFHKTGTKVVFDSFITMLAAEPDLFQKICANT